MYFTYFSFLMKIYKDTIPGFDSKSKIEDEIKKAAAEWGRRCKGENFDFESALWALEIAKTGDSWEYIAKTAEQEEIEKKVKPKRPRIKSTNEIKDLAIAAFAQGRGTNISNDEFHKWLNKQF